MKKLSSMLALSLALAMVMGMTAFAGSPELDTGVKAESKTPGVAASVSADTVDELQSLLGADLYNKLTEKLADTPSGAVKNADPYLVAAVNLTGTVPADGKVTITCSAIAAADVNEWVFYAYHYVNGAYEVLPVTVLGDGLIQISGVTSFSTYVIVAFAKDTAAGQAPAGGNNNITSPAPGTSPKTGETASVAMLIVLVSLAGASVLGVKRAYAAR